MHPYTEACRAAAALANSLRKEWSREARLLLPGLLDKLKDKTTAVIASIHDAVSAAAAHCFQLSDVADDITAALAHKVPKVQEQSLKWIAAMAAALPDQARAPAFHKGVLPAVVKCVGGATPEARTGAMDVLAAVAVASGGAKAIAKYVVDLDDAKKAKIEEVAGAGGRAAAPVKTAAAAVLFTAKVSAAKGGALAVRRCRLNTSG